MKSESMISTPIGSICEVIAGQSPKSSAYNNAGEGLPFYQGKKDFGDRYIGPPQKWTTQITKEAIAGDILMSVRAPVGPINEATQKICIGRGLAAIRHKSDVLKDYLWYGLLWLQPEIVGHEGAVFASINKKGIEALQLPIPPLEEQKRIVAVLDAAFEGIDRARAHTEANLQNARDLLQSEIDRTFEKNREQNGSSQVSELCEAIVDCVNRTAPKVEKETPFIMIRTSNIRFGKLNLEKVKYVDEATYHTWTRRQVPNIGDVLLTREAPMGEACLVETSRKIFLGQRIVSYRVHKAKLLPSYLLFAFQSKSLKEQYSAMGSGATVKHIRVPQSKELEIPNADLDAQRTISEKLKRLSADSDLLQERYMTKLTDLDDLRQSLLQKAFAGELT